MTISHNHFGGGGQSDGIQDGAYGVVIDGNEFDGIVQANGYTRHVDSIQLYGASHTTITNNYLHNFTTAIMAPDGGSHEVVTNNVFIAPSAGSSAIQFGHQDSTTFIHNTVKNTDVFAFVSGSDSDPNRSMVFRDNTMIAASFNTSGCSGCTTSYNLFTTRATGTNALTGTPRLAGGSSPTTYAGWALASGSPGKGNASDGRDRGINPGASIPPGRQRQHRRRQHAVGRRDDHADHDDRRGPGGERRADAGRQPDPVLERRRGHQPRAGR